MGGNAPVGTTFAILERTLKVMSAIQARLHYSMKQEFRLLKVIIADYTPEEYDYEPEEGEPSAKKSDYDDVEVIPVSDPNASTMAQKIVQYQAVLQLAQQAPQLYNLPLLHRQMIEILGIKNATKLIPMSDDQKPTDPVTENQNVLMMKPVKAFSYQDHESHIAVHMSAMQDPKIISLLQGNPQAPQLQAQMMAHVNEHIGFQYRREIEKQLGTNMPPQQMDDENEEEDVNMTPEMEARMSPMLAQAAQQLLAQNKQAAAQQQAQQQAQDPIIQMQMQELQLKAQEQQRKAKKDQDDMAVKMKQLDIEAQRIKSQQLISAGQMAVTSTINTQKLKAQQRQAGAKMAVDMLSSHAQRGHEMNKQSDQQAHQQILADNQIEAQTAKKENK